MSHLQSVFSLAVAAATLTMNCGADQVTGCTSDAQCREGRYCDLEINACVGSVSIVPGSTDPNRIPISAIPDPPSQVRGPSTQTADTFVGVWELRANGETRTRGGGGSTGYQYDEPWTVEISPGQNHHLAVDFLTVTIPAVEGCVLDADLSGEGFLLRGGPCRAEGNRLDEILGAGYIDQFDELTIELRATGEQLATGYTQEFTFTSSGVLVEPDTAPDDPGSIE